MTGLLNLKANQIDIATTPSSGLYPRVLKILDTNDEEIANITAVHSASGKHGISFGVVNNDNGYQNVLQLTQQLDATSPTV